MLKAARRVTGAANSDSDSSSDINATKKPITKPHKKKPDAKAAGPTTVEFGEDDLQHFNADKDKLIKDEMISGKGTSAKPGTNK